MKNAIKITVFTVLLVLTFMSCVPEAELTGRNWNLVNDQYDAKKQGQSSAQGIAPGGTDSNPLNIRTYSGSDIPVPAKIDPTDWDIVISFPKAADILKKSNANLETELKKILQFYSYTTGTDIFSSDNLGSVSDYDFIHRTAGINGSADITVRLKTVPGRLVAKLDGNNYTYAKGNKLDALGDHVTLGRDYYINFSFDITPPPATPQGPFVPPEDQGWALYIYDIAGQFYSGSDPQFTNLPIGYLYIDARTDNMTSPSEWDLRVNAEYTAVFNLLANKISIEKYENRSWVPSNIQITFIDNDTSPLGSRGEIVATFNGEDLKAFRVKATGVKHLTSAKDYFGMKQKIMVIGGTYAGYSSDIVCGDAGFFCNVMTREQNNAASFLADSKIQSDAEGKNVVLWLQVNPEYLSSTPAVDIWLNTSLTNDLANFKQHFKLAYIRTASGSFTTISNTNMFNNVNIRFVDIIAVETVTSDTAAASSGYRDTLKITLDPKYVYNSTLNSKAILISPGIDLFANQNIYHGDYSNWDKEIDGIPYFDFYGNLTF